MNHPNHEEWMSYLYAELPLARRKEFAAHLRSCSECSRDFAVWQEGMAALNKWPLPTRQPHGTTLVTWLKVAAAAVFLLVAGFSLGRTKNATLSAQIAQELRIQVQKQIRAELERITQSNRAIASRATEQALDSLAEEWEAERTTANATLMRAIQEVAARCQSDYATLRQEMETMAVLTADSLRQTRQQIVSLTPYPETETNEH